MTRNQKWLLVATAVVFLLLFLVGCGSSDGGQANPNESSQSDPENDYHGAEHGTDYQIIETFDANVEVQKVEVGGIECVLATRNDNDGFALACPGMTTTTMEVPDE